MVNSDLYRKPHAFECNLGIIAQEAGEGNSARVIQRASYPQFAQESVWFPINCIIFFIFCFIEQTLQDRRIHKVLKCNSLCAVIGVKYKKTCNLVLPMRVSVLYERSHMISREKNTFGNLFCPKIQMRLK